MEIFSNPFNGSLKRYKRRSGYKRLDGAITNPKNMKTVKFGGSPRGSWKIKLVPKLRLKMVSSPLKVWSKLKNAYVNMMVNLAGNVGQLNNGNVLVGKRIPKARQVDHTPYSTTEFDNRLLSEIYKALVASRELATI